MNTVRSGREPYNGPVPDEMEGLLKRLRYQGEIAQLIQDMMAATPESELIEYDNGIQTFRQYDNPSLFYVNSLDRPERHCLIPMLHNLANAVIAADKTPVEIVYGYLPKTEDFKKPLYIICVRCEDVNAN